MPKTYSMRSIVSLVLHTLRQDRADKLFEEMNMEEVFGARLKKGNPVCVDKFVYY